MHTSFQMGQNFHPKPKCAVLSLKVVLILNKTMLRNRPATKAAMKKKCMHATVHTQVA